MAFEFKLPDIGEGVAEGEVVKWLVREGEAVDEDQPIVEIMTDKATVEIASPRSGKIRKLLAGEGQVIGVGKGLVMIDENGAASKEAKKEVKKETKPETRVETKTEPKNEESGVLFKATPSNGSRERVLASPATRKMARERGLDLAQVSGSGPSGRVTRGDLLGALSGKGGSVAQKSTFAYTPRTTTPSGGEERIPLRGIRKKIAEHMVKSRKTAMHFSQIDEVDFTQLAEFREKAKELAASKGVKLTYLSFILPALCAALKKFPGLNGSLDDEKQEIVIKHYYNIGIAVQTESGLIVPVIKNADQKTIWELAGEIQLLADKARQGRLSVDELQGGTFTVTSTGASGGMFATPIINHPEVGILGINRIQPTPVVRDGQIVVRQIGHVSLSLDHRVIDGAVGADFLSALIRYLEDPVFLFLE